MSSVPIVPGEHATPRPEANADAAATARAEHPSRGSRVAAALRSVLRSRWLGPAVGVAIIVALVSRLGAEPFLRGIGSLSPSNVAVALALTGVATAAAAWRWKLVCAALGAPLTMRGAVVSYYRSQLLNSVLPGGVLGDVERAVRHGQQAGRLSSAARGVVIERSLGQIVQFAMLTVVCVAVLAGGGGVSGVALPFGRQQPVTQGLAPAAPGPGFIIAAAVAIAVVVVAAISLWASSRLRRALRRELAQLGSVLRSPSVCVRIVIASVLVVTCHVATLAVATASVGVRVPPLQMFALGLFILTVAALPFNVAGWGPREGAAAWAFGAVGIGAELGVAAATLFGVLALISVLPGLVLPGLLRSRIAPRAAPGAAPDATPGAVRRAPNVGGSEYGRSREGEQ